MAYVGKQYPALSWHRGRQRTTPEISGAGATHRPQQKVDTHLHSYTHTHSGRNTQTTNRQIKASLSCLPLSSCSSFHSNSLNNVVGRAALVREENREVCVSVCVCVN